MLASEAIYQILGSIFNDRVGPSPLPEGFDKSETYITYEGISSMPLMTVKNWTGHDHVRIQVNVMNHDNIECEKAAIKVKREMDSQSIIKCEFLGERYAGLDVETQLWQIQIDFYMWQITC
ncbi:hypothetical protein ACINWC743_1574 [Acinetobacter sp. WC-743]|uniref:hypothetical protein n=1 Tax=Acinetobacter sp. WC-743 TaxID=903945 RepID=UPI0002AEAEE2|nr:hypothetical protein [Acinetobacter sp. WC-743]ELW82067.1 hypothetical protein ACINWC743_1574 [Acinetobacter sp. WC-743]